MKKVALILKRLRLSWLIGRAECRVERIRKLMRESDYHSIHDRRSLTAAEVELVCLRADYNATFTPGRRRTWKTA